MEAAFSGPAPSAPGAWRWGDAGWDGKEWGAMVQKGLSQAIEEAQLRRAGLGRGRGLGKLQ